jgi:nitrogen fixation protein FixH
MNWGIKIILAFVAFVLFLGILIYRVYQSDMNLVSTDYYKQELAFQQQIEKLENERALVTSASIEHDPELQRLIIRFPADAEITTAELVLYRPSDASLDLNLHLKLDPDNTQAVSTTDLTRGLWQLKLEWQDRSQSYLKQQNLYLP